MLHPRPEILAIAPYVGGESKAAGHNRVVKPYWGCYSRWCING